MSITLTPDVLKKYLNPVFVETGSYKGDGIALALNMGFKEVRSVEKDEELAKEVAKRFVGASNVKLYQGDSAKLISIMLQDIVEDVTFWLDSHPFESHLELENIPLMEELEAIRIFVERTHRRVVVMVDDMSVFSEKDSAFVTAEVWKIYGITRVCRENNLYRPNEILVAQSAQQV